MVDARTNVYFFWRDNYLRYDRVLDRTDEDYPLSIAGYWPGFTEAGFDTGVDAAVNWQNGKIYFFKGNQYLRYDIAADKADPGYPLLIAGNWPGFTEAGFDTGVNTAINFGNGKVYFFKGNQYLRYDIAADKVDPGYPLPIAGNWSGFTEAGFDTGVNAAINWGNGKVYFFKGNQYLRYDIASDKVDPGYPLSIAGHWPGFTEAGFAEGVSAAIDLSDESAEIWLAGAEIIKSPVNGPRFLPLPWRGVLHTTEGSTLEGAISSFRSTNFWPHFTIEPNTLRVVQHLPLTIGARSLSDKATSENAAHCIQIEIVGFAAQTPSWAPEQLAFIRDVMRQIMYQVPIPRQSDRTFLDSTGVGTHPENRMSVNEWKLFSGWCGHQHVPGETHWDPGAIDITALLS